MNARLTDNRIAVTVTSGDNLDPRRFTVREQMSSLFHIEVLAYSRNPGIALDAIACEPATLCIDARKETRRTWQGICSHIELSEVEPDGYSTYRLTIVPKLWLCTQRRNYRIFQQQSDPDIVLKILGEWGIDHSVRFDRGAHKKRKFRVQYAESDYAFACRLLEDAGVSFYFDESSTLVLTDRPQSRAARNEVPFITVDEAANVSEYVTSVAVGKRVRPGKYTLRDHDYRRPAGYPVVGEASVGEGSEARLERYHYVPGAFLFGSDDGETTPAADDRGKTRHLPQEGATIAARRLDAKRANAQPIAFHTTAHDLAPGVVLTISDHPHPALSDGRRILVLETVFTGASDESWQHRCQAVSAEVPYHPPLATPKARVPGVESATVVGPPGEEIHCDEFGRVRVHFHWDRESGMNEQSSCWIHVSQPWSGTGFGGTNLPRVGQEVIVSFLGGDPDRPIITGRVYTNINRTPYKLPDNKTRSGWRTMSSPGGGGFNEIMFEDAKGTEQVYVQAERNMDTLVKNDDSLTVKHDRKKTVENDETTIVKRDRTEVVENDETITICHDRTEVVHNDETITVGNNRTEVVENDESITVNHDRIEMVANDEEVTIGNNRALTVQSNSREMVGNNRSRAVGANETVQVGQDRSVDVGANHTQSIGANETREVGSNQSVTVARNQSLEVGGNQKTRIARSQQVKVGKSANEVVTLAKGTQVGGAYSITVGGAMNTTVGGIAAEQVALMKRVDVGQKIEIKCGDSQLIMEASGKITLKGTEILIEGTKVRVIGDPIELN